MTFDINSINDISKLLAFIRVAAKAKFKVPKELVDEAIQRCHAFARKHGIRIEFTGASVEQMLKYAQVGAIVGAAAGLVLGGVGVLQGAALGAAAGAALAHVRITVTFGDNADGAVFSII